MKQVHVPQLIGNGPVPGWVLVPISKPDMDAATPVVLVGMDETLLGDDRPSVLGKVRVK